MSTAFTLRLSKASVHLQNHNSNTLMISGARPLEGHVTCIFASGNQDLPVQIILIWFDAILICQVSISKVKVGLHFDFVSISGATE